MIMAQIFIISTHGSEDPTRSSLPWLVAKGAVEGGHKPRIVLSGDAAMLAYRTVAESVQGVGIPPLKELMEFALKNEVPVFV
jgi:predicted peroxiredoxin